MVEIDKVLYRLVAVSVIAHSYQLHLAYFVYGKAVITIVKKWGHLKHFVYLFLESLFAAHQLYESLKILKYWPSVVQTVPFSKRITPFERIEWWLKLAVLILAAHPFGFGVKYIFITLRLLVILLGYIYLAHLFCHTRNAIIGIGILKGARYVLVNLHIIRHIA